MSATAFHCLFFLNFARIHAHVPVYGCVFRWLTVPSNYILFAPSQLFTALPFIKPHANSAILKKVAEIVLRLHLNVSN